MKTMKLTAEQIEWIDSINQDRSATDNTLKVAMCYHSNRMSRLNKEKKRFWKNIAETFDLDLEENHYRVNNVRNEVEILKDEEEHDG